MARGIMLGMLMQLISAVGYLVLVNVDSIKSEWFRTGLMICFAGIVAVVVSGYIVFTGQQDLASIAPREYVVIAIGAIMVMFVAQLIFFFAVKVSNLTTVSLTLLAFPFVSLALEIILGRVKLSSLGWYELIGFALIVAGYVVYVSKPHES